MQNLQDQWLTMDSKTDSFTSISDGMRFYLLLKSGRDVCCSIHERRELSQTFDSKPDRLL